MKKNKLLIIGIVGVLAYLYFKKRQKAKASAQASVETIESEVEEVMEDNINDDLLS